MQLAVGDANKDVSNVITKDEMRTLIREELEAVEGKIDTLDSAIRGNGTPGLKQRVASLEQSRTLNKKLWGSILAVVVAVAGAMATKLIA